MERCEVGIEQHPMAADQADLPTDIKIPEGWCIGSARHGTGDHAQLQNESILESSEHDVEPLVESETLPCAELPESCFVASREVMSVSSASATAPVRPAGRVS